MADKTYTTVYKTWNKQPSETSGFPIRAAFGYEIFAPMALYATIGVNQKGGFFYKRIPCPSKTWESPWLERLTTADVKENAQTIGAEANFDAVGGTFKTFNLNTQLSVTKVVAGIERQTSPFDYANFFVRDAARVMANIAEDRFVKQILDNGAQGHGTPRAGHAFDVEMVVEDGGVVDMYKTIGRAVRYCTQQGWREEDMVVYMSPALCEHCMAKGVIAGNIGASSAGLQLGLHKNMLGVIQGIPVVRVPRLYEWEGHATTPVNMLVCNKSKIFLLEWMVTPLHLGPCTEKHLDATDRYLKALSWIEWAMQTENSAFFLNITLA